MRRDGPELGKRDGLAYALILPEVAPTAGVVILHGAGSAKESHFNFGRLCREAGMAALAYDARGHSARSAPFGPSAVLMPGRDTHRPVGLAGPVPDWRPREV